MFSHKALEKNIGWLMVLTFLVVSIGMMFLDLAFR